MMNSKTTSCSCCSVTAMKTILEDLHIFFLNWSVVNSCCESPVRCLWSVVYFDDLMDRLLQQNFVIAA